MDRASLVRQVEHALGYRHLVWAGIRGDDVESIADLPQLSASFSIIGSYRRRPSVESLALEDLTGRRVDLEQFDIDDHRTEPEVLTFRQAMLRALSRPSALLPYRPSRFLSALWFTRKDRCLNLGLFGAHQFAFEHKPWVETAVADLGLPTIPWVYVADEEQLDTIKMLDQGPVVLRMSRTSGGNGFVVVQSREDLVRCWPDAEETFVSVSPFIPDALPLNVGGTVWRDRVTVHYPSVQLIGLPQCVTRPFGYCGNDFGLARDLDREVLSRIEQSTIRVGHWLRTMGYLGTFGVDYLLERGGTLRFTEVNPRFQGSTVASGRLAVESGEACLLLEHIAATLGLSAPPSRSLAERLRATNPLAQLVVHWTGSEPAHLDPTTLHRGLLSRHDIVDVTTRPDLVTDRGAVVARLCFRGRLTNTGFDLREPCASAVSHWVAASLLTSLGGASHD